jgi:hypothetical protein
VADQEFEECGRRDGSKGMQEELGRLERNGRWDGILKCQSFDITPQQPDMRSRRETYHPFSFRMSHVDLAGFDFTQRIELAVLATRERAHSSLSLPAGAAVGLCRADGIE